MNKKTILVVDDEKMIRELLESVLSKMGYNVIACETIGEAIQEIERSDWSLLLSDLQIPNGLEGIELAKIAKREKPELPVIIMTGQPWLVPEKNPADKILPKPSPLEKIRETITNLIK